MGAPEDFDWESLKAAADEAMTHAYAPYSHFSVGAAATVDDGRVVIGLQRRERGVRRRAVRGVRAGQPAAHHPVAGG